MPSRRVVGLIFLAGIVLSSTLAADESVLLRRASKVGDKLVAVIQSDQNMSQVRSDGASMQMKQSLVMEMAMEVQAVAPDGTSDVKVTYRRIAINADGVMGKVDYDSADPAKSNGDNPALIDAKARLGKSLVMKVTPQGEVKEVKGGDEISAAILAGISDPRMREMARQQLAQTMNQDGLIQQLSVLTLRTTDQPKSVGQDWSWDQVTNAGFATLSVKTTCTLDKINPETAEVSVRAVTTVGKPAEGVAVMIDPATKVAGKTVVSRKDASLFTSDLTQSVKLNARVQNLTISSDMTSTSRVTVKPDAAK